MNRIERTAFVSFVEPQQSELLHLHANSIRKFDKNSPVIYISNEPVSVPKGCLNLYGIDTHEQGLNGLTTLLSAFKVIHEQQNIDRFIVSNVSCVMRQRLNADADLCLFLENRTTNFCKSVFSFHVSVLFNVIEYMKNNYNFDLFARNAIDTFLFLANSITAPNQKLIVQIVNKHGKSANGAFFHSGFFSNIEQLLTVFLFVECADFQFLGQYVQARLDVNEAVKRAMQHTMKAWKQTNQKRTKTLKKLKINSNVER